MRELAALLSGAGLAGLLFVLALGPAMPAGLPAAGFLRRALAHERGLAESAGLKRLTRHQRGD